MDAFAWFWLALIICIITIGVNGTLCTYWRYKYTSNKKNETVKDEPGERHIITGFSKNEYRIGRGIQDIFQAQLDIATKRIYQKGRERRKVQGTGEIIQGRSGALMAALQNPNYSVIPDGEGVIAHSNLPLYTRFLDMKKHGNYQIYNRQIYGILYHDTLGKIKYEYQDYVRERVKEMFVSSLK